MKIGIVIAAFVSPFRADRETTRALFGDDEFLEVHVDLPAELAAERDTTGLYAKAQAGEPCQRRHNRRRSPPTALPAQTPGLSN